MNPLQFFTDLTNPDLSFLPKALIVAVMSSIICGVVGTHVVLRGMAFIGDAVAHSVFPGLAIAFVVEGNLVLGGTIAGLVTAVLVAVFAQNRRLNETSIIGVLFVAAFALGVVIISQTPGYAGSLEQFLFGSITGIPDSDLIVVAVTGLVVLGLLFLFHKELVTVSLDRESARAMGIPVFWFDLLLYMLVTFAVVVSVQTIGNILVLALLVTPAATARLVTDRLGVMMAISPVIGGLGALVGLYVSWGWDLPTGGTIVLVLTVVFLLTWFLSPRQGILVRAVSRAMRRHGHADAAVAAPAPTPVPVSSAAGTSIGDGAGVGTGTGDSAGTAARVGTVSASLMDSRRPLPPVSHEMATSAARSSAAPPAGDRGVMPVNGSRPGVPRRPLTRGRRTGLWPLAVILVPAVAGIALVVFSWIVPQSML
jgi:manganese/iron transport system permease protein